MALRDHLLTIGIVLLVALAAILTFFIVGYHETKFLLLEAGHEHSPPSEALVVARCARHQSLVKELNGVCLHLLGSLAAEPPAHADPHYELLLSQLWHCKEVMLSHANHKMTDASGDKLLKLQKMVRSLERINKDFSLMVTFEPKAADNPHAIRLSLMADWLRRVHKKKQAQA